METLSGFLAHFGIKGMRWGISRPRGPAGTVSSNPSVSKSVSRGGKSGVKALSDDELRNLVNRMELEKRFEALATPPAAAVKAQGLIKRTLKENGSRQVSRVAKTAADIAIEAAFNKYATTGMKGSKVSAEIATRIGPGKKKDKKGG